jgi:hypothetical protein
VGLRQGVPLVKCPHRGIVTRYGREAMQETGQSANFLMNQVVPASWWRSGDDPAVAGLS